MKDYLIYVYKGNSSFCEKNTHDGENKEGEQDM